MGYEATFVAHRVRIMPLFGDLEVELSTHLYCSAWERGQNASKVGAIDVSVYAGTCKGSGCGLGLELRVIEDVVALDAQFDRPLLSFIDVYTFRER